VQSLLGQIVDAGEDIGQLGLGGDVVELGGDLKLYMNAARWPPRSLPANIHARRPRATPRNALSAVLLVRQRRPSVRNRANRSHRVYGPDQDQTIAFTPFGLENLNDLIKHYKANPDTLRRSA
jgi:hypothetical protein